jgi:hypothetical protein
MPKVQPLRPTHTPSMFALQFCAHPMHRSRSDSPATLMVMMRELRVRRAVLRTGITSRGNRRPRRPCSRPTYTFGHAQSHSDPLPRGTWLSLMRVRGGGLAAGSTLRQNRQPRHPCTPHVCPGHLHSAFPPTYTLGHAPFAPELEIAIFAPAAPKLKVLW